MTVRSLRLAAAALATVALAACGKKDEAPATTDSTVPANATTTAAPTPDSTVKVDTAAKATVDSAKPATDSAKK